MIGTIHRPLLKFNQNAKKAFTKYCKSSQTLVQMNVALSSSRQWSGICELNMWKFYYTLQSPLRFYGFFDKFLIQNRPLTVNQSTEWGMLIKKWFFLVSLNQRKKKNCKAVFLRPHSKNDALIFQTLSFFKNVRILRMRLFFCYFHSTKIVFRVGCFFRCTSWNVFFHFRKWVVVCEMHKEIAALLPYWHKS